MADNFTDTFTKEETIKALRCCYSDEGLCSICPYENTITSCTQLLKRDAFDIIKSQEQFIESQNELISKLVLECKNNISNEAKVKHGEWVYEDGDVGYNVYRCSKCGGKVVLDDEGGVYKYCPNCGAKMDGEREAIK